MRRVFVAVLLALLVVGIAGCHHKVQNPIANVNSKQPDKVLFDRAMQAMNKGHYDVARMTLQTLINTYPDSEYIARAKLAVGDSWYAEGGSAALAQAEIEYKDFITFFPNMPEAAEAQLKVANIHYKQMEKPDRDYTHAKRAEEEYKQLILQFPDSKLVPEAKERLREVQEVLAEREYLIGHFYYTRENYVAAIARLQSMVDTYPLFSQADDALFVIGNAYEKQIEGVRAARIREDIKGKLIKEYSNDAAAAYDRILTRYPVMDRAKDARERLIALHRPVPTATPEMIAQNKAEQASRSSEGTFGHMFSNFRRAPDVSETAKIGEPTLVDPKQTGAPELVRHADEEIRAAYAKTAPPSPSSGGSQGVSVQTIKATPGPNEPIPGTSTPANTADQGTPAGQELTPTSDGSNNTSTSSSSSANNNGSVAPLPAPDQVNEAATDGSSSQGAAAATGAAASNSDNGKDPKDDTSSSRTKKKKGLRKLIPF